MSGTLVFCNGIDNEQSYLICYDYQTDEIVHQIPIDNALKHMTVFKHESIYFLSVIDQLGTFVGFQFCLIT